MITVVAYILAVGPISSATALYLHCKRTGRL